MAKQPKRVALVTGASRGIGLGIAEQLARCGFDLAINGRRDAAAVANVVAALSDRGVEAIYCQGDVADAGQRQAIVDRVRQQFGRLDVLVNNVGVAANKRDDILEADEASFERLIRINLQGPYFLTQLVSRWMIQQHHCANAFSGVIVNISSVSASQASVNRGDYCISKAGVAMATMLWATRLAEFGIQVYEIRPGIIRTDMTARADKKYDELIEEGLSVERRWGTAEDVGRTVAVLARGEISYATGNVIMVDGGLTLPRL